VSSSSGLSSASGSFHARRSLTAALTPSIGSQRQLMTRNTSLVKTVLALFPPLLPWVTIALALLGPLPARAIQILSMILTPRCSLLLRSAGMLTLPVERNLLKCRSGSSMARATIKVLPLFRCITKAAMDTEHPCTTNKITCKKERRNIMISRVRITSQQLSPSA